MDMNIDNVNNCARHLFYKFKYSMMVKTIQILTYIRDNFGFYNRFHNLILNLNPTPMLNNTIYWISRICNKVLLSIKDILYCKSNFTS